MPAGMFAPGRVAFTLAATGLLLIRPGAARAQEARPGTISGVITDAARNPLSGATIRVVQTGTTTKSDQEGVYHIASVSPGAYAIVVAYIGFDPDTLQVTVPSGAEARVSAALHARTNALPELIVTAARPRGDAQALNQQQQADNIVDVVPAEIITSLPNTNVADAVGRLPGVTLERDEGEGKYIQIRGTEPRLSNVTIDGAHVPSPEGNTRSVKLDVISSDIIGAIELNKTLSADMDGDAIGGSVNLVTKTAGDKPTVSLGGLGGLSDIQHGRGLYQFTGTLGRRFGADKRLGVLVGGTYDWNGRGIDDLEPGVSTFDACGGAGAAAVWCGGEDFRRYQYQRSRLGFGGGIDYRLGGGSGVYLRGLFANFQNYGYRWLQNASPGSFLTPTQSNPDGTAAATVQNRKPDEQIYSIVGGGNQLLGRVLVDYSGSFSRGRRNRLNERTTGFASTLTNVAYAVDFPDGIAPRFTPTNANIDDPKTYVLDNSQLANDRNAQREIGGALNLTIPYGSGSSSNAFKFGGKIRDNRASQVLNEQVFGAQDTYTMDHLLATFDPAGYYKGQYPLGPVPDFNAIESYLASNPSELTLDVTRTHLRSDPNTYTATERVYAGYAMNTMEFGALRLQAGARIEATRAGYTGNKVLLDATGAYVSTQPVTGTSRYTNVLPSVQVRYAVDPQTNVRLAYGMGIARPVLTDLVPFATEDDRRQQLSVGNPNLKPTRANNFDVLVEHYFESVGVISAAGFYKDLHEPIYAGIRTPITTGPNTGFIQVQSTNGPKAHVYGVELTWQQQLTFLPGALTGLGVRANYTHAWSEASFPDGAGRTDKPALLRQAPDLFNVGVTYDHYGFSTRVGLTYNGASIFQYNYQDGATGGVTGPNGDVYLYSRAQLDAQVSYRFRSGLELYANGLNLNNAAFGFYQGSSPYTIQREYYGLSTSFGVRLSR